MVRSYHFIEYTWSSQFPGLTPAPRSCRRQFQLCTISCCWGDLGKWPQQIPFILKLFLLFFCVPYLHPGNAGPGPAQSETKFLIQPLGFFFSLGLSATCEVIHQPARKAVSLWGWWLPVCTFRTCFCFLKYSWLSK